MPIKMIVTDLDRTLLRTDKSISDYTADVLNRCHQSGVKVVFATARPKRTVKHFFERVKTDAVILHNGAVTYVEDRLLNSCGIASHIKNNILMSISRDYPEATLSVEINDVFYANFDVSTVWNYTQAIRSDFTDLPDQSADKIIVGVSSQEDIERFSKYLPDELYIEMNDGKLGLIMHRGATKQTAIKKQQNTSAAIFMRLLLSVMIITISECCGNAVSVLQWVMPLMRSKLSQTIFAEQTIMTV